MRVLNVVHDALILLFTWYKTKGNLRKYIGVVKLQNNLVTRMLLNGAVYFIVHLILNILDIVLTVTGTFSDVTIFNAIFTPLILSHFFLSIREDHRTREDLASTSSQIESQMLRFDLHIAVEGLAGLDEDETRRSAARVRLL